MRHRNNNNNTNNINNTNNTNNTNTNNNNNNNNGFSSGTSMRWLFVHCFQIELEFGMLVFVEG